MTLFVKCLFYSGYGLNEVYWALGEGQRRILCCSEDYAARACLVYNLGLNAYGQLGGCLKVAFPGRSVCLMAVPVGLL